MKLLMLWLVIAGTLSSSAAYAQAVTGTWQGTLSAGKDLRILMTISSAAGDGLSGMLYSIDQSPQGISVNPVTLEGTTLRFAVSAVGATFEGQLSANGNSIAGSWSQGGRSLPLTLMRATPETAWPIPAPPKAMAADARAVFEVATIKPSNPDTPGKVFTVRGRQFTTINTTLSDLIGFAYRLHAAQIADAPEWAESAKYDITGQPEGQGQPSERQLRAMVQKLLEDRFKLAVHRDTRELPVYVLSVGKSGARLTRNDTNPNGLPSLMFRGPGVLPALNANMADLASVLQTAVLDRPVVDRTALAGRFDFTLTWTPDESQFRGLGVRVPAPANDANAPPGLFTAIQEQLGLRLESSKAPVEVFVIDRVERPSDN
jgi:bla regulator protein blaR1